jgi:hypothetical protein
MYPVAYLTREDQLAAAERLGVDLAVIKAVTAVEAAAPATFATPTCRGISSRATGSIA